MFDKLNALVKKILLLSKSVDCYKKETIIQSLPVIAYVNRAKNLIDEKKFDAAEDLLKNALIITDNDALVYKYLGLVYEKTQKIELAIENYQLSADKNPLDKFIWQRLGFALITDNKFEQAVKSFENADKIKKSDSDTHMGWGMAFMKLKKYEQAHEKFCTAVKLNKYNFSAIFLSAVMEIKLEMYDKADLKLSFLTGVSPNEANTFEYARLKAIKNDYTSAIFYAKKSIDINPSMVPAFVLLGQIYSQMLDEENSMESFKLAEEKNSSCDELYYEWGKALERFEKYDLALDKYLKAYELNNHDSKIEASLAFCYVLCKNFDKAEILLNDVLEKEPDNNKVQQALAVIAYENGDIDKAISVFRTNDEDAVNCYYLAKCYEKQSDETRVKDYYESALRINPKYTTAYIDYVKYLISKNDFQSARLKLQRALKNINNDINLLNLMFYTNYVLVKENISEYNIKETLSIAEKVESIDPNLFEYSEQKQELINLLPEREKN